ncbi:hypothetical protein GCM10010232_41610 [Streptomyces amakusaensis]|uniref:Uncharacterized protein n=2 Tax=Streptomyces TaxID=1883 RepID=A0A918PQ52_9ACTN|nr:hypothetical protein [Streptomyces inusitatus]GGZ19191.1 hypothetical protein GCM10010387_09860 [Streptomyces inusitatus]
MSFGDPNNPYGQQQQGGQPDYGYPQQGQPPAQPGYGYPQAPPVQPYDGFGGAPTKMPGSVSAARVMLYVIAGFQVIGAVIMFLSGAAISAAKDDPALKDDVQFQELADLSSGAVYGIGVLVLLWGALAIFLAVKFGKGGNGIRITAMVFAIITAILGIYPFILIGLAHTVLAILIAVFVGKSDGGAWFNRPRH